MSPPGAELSQPQLQDFPAQELGAGGDSTKGNSALTGSKGAGDGDTAGKLNEIAGHVIEHNRGDVTLEEALRLTGMGKFHIGILLVSGFLVMAAVLETVVVGYLLPAASCELSMSSSDKGLLGAASYAGIVLSSYLWGMIADVRGRKSALVCATLLDVVFSLASSLAPNFVSLLVLRFVVGICASAPAALSFAYLGEFYSQAFRSRAIIWIAAFPSLGVILLPGVAWAVLPQSWSLDLGFVMFGPWRLLLVLTALLSLMSVLLLLLAPESPKFLSTSDPQRALAVLRRIYAWNTGNSETMYPVSGLLVERVTVATIQTAQLPPPAPFKPSKPSRARIILQQTALLFRPRFLKNTMLVCVIQFGNLASANGLQIWLPEIFNTLAGYEEQHPGESAQICVSRQGANSTNTGTGTGTQCSAMKDQVFINNIIIGAVSLAMPVLCGFVVNLLGKRNLLVACLLLTGTLGVCLTVVTSSGAVLALASVVVAINTMGISHLSSIVVELFPTNVRAMAVSLHLMIGRMGSIVGNLIFGALLNTQCPLAFYFIGGALLGCGVLSCFLPAKGKYAS